MFGIDKRAFGKERNPLKRSLLLVATLLAAVTLLFGLAPATPAEAVPLDLTLQMAPDLMSDFIDVRYDASSRTLTARGYAEQVRGASGEPVTIVNGTFEIVVTISGSGTVTSGTMTITGEVPALGISDGTLLAGEVKTMGYGTAEAPLEFQFTTSTGSLAFQFGPQVNVILSQSGFGGSFTGNFSSNSIAVAGIGW